MTSTPTEKAMFREIEEMIEREVLYDDLSRQEYKQIKTK